MPRGDAPLGEIATDVLFENDAVKIWNLVVDPGESSDWHMHGRDYVTIVVEGAGLTVEYDDGTSDDSPSGPGTWRYHDEHKIHRVVNNSDTRYVNVLVELKGRE
jgi:quercetin dioxygenase-like cupin family protein